MSANLTPLATVKALFGSYEAVSLAASRDEKASYKWAHLSKFRDAGDFPSARIMRALLAHSDAHGLGLTADHLVRGAPEAEIKALLAARPNRAGEVSPGGGGQGAAGVDPVSARPSAEVLRGAVPERDTPPHRDEADDLGDAA